MGPWWAQPARPRTRREHSIGHSNFPDVMSTGGFDAVIGNPPWERIKLQEQEFFASREPDIAAAPTADVRGRLIAQLKNAADASRERRLFDEFEQAKRTAEASSVFAREAGRFPLTGKGDVNTYALFAELFAALIHLSGQMGIIVPTGIATDATTAPFFANLISENRIRSMWSFENEEFIFPNVHHAFKFSILTLTGPRPNGRPDFVFFARQTTQVADARRHFSLTAAELGQLNPNTRTAPIFRSRYDAELTAKIYSRVPVLIRDGHSDGNPWGISFMSMFHMANDSDLFHTQPQSDRVPLFEAKMIHQFNHRWSTYQGGETRELTEHEKADPGFEVAPRYWIDTRQLRERLAERNWSHDWLIGWRDICRATDERTLIAGAIPLSATNNTILLLFPEVLHHTPLLIGALSSLVVDYVARQKVGGTHLVMGVLKQLAMIPPTSVDSFAQSWLQERVVELTYTSHSLAPFARALGYVGPPFPWNEERRALVRAELDAWYARAYGLTRSELRYILDPADVMGEDYPSETFRVLKNNEMKKFGEYRTRLLVLDAWDRMEAGDLK